MDGGVCTGLSVPALLLQLSAESSLFARHMHSAWRQESAAMLARDGMWLAERTVQWIAAGIALWAVSRRYSLGRWLAAGLALYLALKAAPGLLRAVHVMLGHPDTGSGGLRLSSPAEGFGAALGLLPVVTALAILAYSLALAEGVRTYFQPVRPRENGAKG